MLDKLAEGMNPKTAKAIKIAAIVAVALAGAIVAGVVLYKVGAFQEGVEVVEEITETAAQAA